MQRGLNFSPRARKSSIATAAWLRSQPQLAFGGQQGDYHRVFSFVHTPEFERRLVLGKSHVREAAESCAEKYPR